jgi:hypothetical protein
MPRSGTFLEAMTSYYSNLAFGALRAMRTTQEDIRTGNFSVSKAVGSAASIWLDASEGWWNAVLVTASEPLPTVFLRVGPLGGTDTQEVRVLVPEDPEFTGLVRIGDGRTIPNSLVSIRPLKDRDGLEVKLTGLSELRDKGALPPGVYQGLVHMGQKPLAIIMVRVDPKMVTTTPKAKGAKRRKKKR